MADEKDIDVREIKGDKDEYNPRRKREILKDILIAFLAVLLVLTFFSNTIMNKSLAEISTERTTSGKLTERIRGSGLVESNQSYGVTVDGNKVIDTIKVKVGKSVKKGDVLFTVGTGESEALTAAETALAQLELEYNKALVDPKADYSVENQAIKNAREDLAEAIEKRDRALASQGDVEAAKETQKNNKAQLNHYTKLQSKLTAVIAAIDADEYTGAPAEYTGELILLKNAYDEAELYYSDMRQIYVAMLSGKDKTKPTDDGDAPTEPENTVTQEDIAKAEFDVEQALYVRDEAKADYIRRKVALRKEYTEQLTDAENKVEYYTSLVEDAGSDMIGDGMTIDALEADVSAKKRALEELISQLSKTQKDDETQNKKDDLDLKAQKEEIEKAKKKVEKLRKENETTEIKAKYDGIVSAINFRAGDETVPDTDIMTIDISEDGYTVKITVDAEKTKKIKKGVEAEVMNNWSGGITAVLKDIRNDTVANSKNRILVFDVTGSVDNGSYLDLSIPCGSGSYDAIVPKSAVYSDKDGKFVLMVESKSSPLGNRYYARRVGVDVISSDEVSSAVSGGISNGDYVITASSAPVKPGDQVRMKEK